VEVDAVDRWWPAVAAALVAAAAGVYMLIVPGPAGASGISAKVSPNQHLAHGQWVTVSGHGLPRIKGQTWFVDQCTARVQHRMNPATDTQHCALTAAKVLKVGHDGSFSLRYRVITGIVGDGYCGTPGHLTCELTVADAAGGGTVLKIGFRLPPAHPTSATATSNTTTSTSTTSTSTTSTTSPLVTSTTS
jgi:hypothetical protein